MPLLGSYLGDIRQPRSIRPPLIKVWHRRSISCQVHKHNIITLGHSCNSAGHYYHSVRYHSKKQYSEVLRQRRPSKHSDTLLLSCKRYCAYLTILPRRRQKYSGKRRRSYNAYYSISQNLYFLLHPFHPFNKLSVDDRILSCPPFPSDIPPQSNQPGN